MTNLLYVSPYVQNIIKIDIVGESYGMSREDVWLQPVHVTPFRFLE
jgi:hypothetical protein